MCSSVDLPQPEGPVTQTNSPAATVSVTSASAWTRPLPGNERPTPSSSINAAIGKPRSS